MTRLVKSSAVVAATLWVGVLFCLGIVVAPYLFILASRNSPAVPNPGVAADLIGPLLYSSDVGDLVVAAGLVAALLFLRSRGEVPLGGAGSSQRWSSGLRSPVRRELQLAGAAAQGHPGAVG